MTLPRPDPSPTPAPAGVRLDVRLGAGRPVSYTLPDGGEFLVGGADRCQLVLPGHGVPAAVGRFSRSGEAITFRRLDPAFPVLVNGALAGMNPLPVGPGDRVAVGPADVTVNRDGAHLRPAFHPIPPAAEPAVPPPAAPDRDAERRQLAAERAELAELARELEADRVLWYRRRQEIEQEIAARNAELATAALVAAGPSPTALAEREAQLEATRRELEAIRDNLQEQYESRREQLAQMQEVIRGATADLHDRRQRLDADARARAAELDERERQIAALVDRRLAERRAELDAQYAERLADLDRRPPAEAARERELQEREDRLAAERANFERQREEHVEALLRLDRREAALESRTAEVARQAAEIDERYDQLRRDSQELEETVALAGAEREALAAEKARLARQKTDQDTHAARLADRSAQIEAQQATLAILRATLERREENARQEAAQLAADRARLDDAQHDLDLRLHEAERLRSELVTAEAGTAERERLAAERAALLEATLAEIQQQKDAVAGQYERFRQKEAELDARSADLAEQAALLRGRLQQALDLQARLEADRAAVREREGSLADADAARQTFQEQLRRRAEELTARSRHLDDAGRRLADEQTDLARLKAEAAAARNDFTHRAAELAEREAALSRQVQRLQETGRATAAARKELADARAAWEAERQRAAADQAAWKAEFDALLRQVPDLDAHARDVSDRLAAAREVLKGQLGELHAFAGQTRGELDGVRAELRAEADRLAAREQALDRARADHRRAVSEFRQQLHEWQATIAELKQQMGRTASTADAKEAAAAEAAAALAAQAAALEAERKAVAERRREVDRHLHDMQAWYQQKLRELADSGLEAADTLAAFDIDPADRQLGELLQGRGLVDADTLRGLWAEARRQRKPLRRTLLDSGAVTLYQLSLIEAGDLHRLHFGRLKVLDRVRANPREAVYRVSDPLRPDQALVLRHLAEGQMEDAVRPDEFRQRFAAVAGLDARHLWATLEVLEVHGRPAALQEWPAGLPAAEWGAEAAVPGVWLRLVTEAAVGLSVAHAAGLTLGRLTADRVWLAPDGRVKLAGVGEPAWLAGSAEPPDPSPADDLRALGELAETWSRLGLQAKKRGRGKPFPDTLLAVARRLTAVAELPMGDTAAGANPYRSAEDLLDDLDRLGKLFPCPPDAWRAVTGPAAPGDGLRQSA